MTRRTATPPLFVRSLGEAFASRRHDLGLSQQELADRLGLASSESISRYERGEREPRVTTLVRLAEALETTPEQLLRAAGGGGGAGCARTESQSDLVAERTGALPRSLIEGALMEALDAAVAYVRAHSEE